VRDAGNLLTRAGLMIPSVDLDEVTVHYSDPDGLVKHIRCTLTPPLLPWGKPLCSVLLSTKSPTTFALPAAMPWGGNF